MPIRYASYECLNRMLAAEIDCIYLGILRTDPVETLRTLLIVLTAHFFLTSSVEAQDAESPDTANADPEIRKVDSLNRVATELRFNDPEKADELRDSAYQKAKALSYLKGQARALEIDAELSFFYDSKERGYRCLERADSIRRTIDDLSGMGRSRMETGVILLNKHYYKKADSLFEVAKDYYERTGNISRMARTHYWRSRGKHFQNQYPKALRHAHKTLTLYDSVGGKEGKAKAYRQIGRVHWAQENKQKARNAFEKAAKLFKIAGDARGIASAHSLMGRYYLEEGDHDSASYHYRRSIAFNDSAGARKSKAYAEANLARVFVKKGRTDSSERLSKKAMKVFYHYRDPTGMILVYDNLGRVHERTGALDSALAYYRKAVPKADQIKSFEEQAKLYERIAAVLNQQGKGSEAYSTLKKASAYEDSLALREQQKKMAELEAKYEMRERKKELELKEAQLERKKVQQYALIGGLLIVLLFSGFIYYQFRQKKKANIALSEKNRVIEEKNLEILHSIRYASRIQNAVLPDKRNIQKHFSSGFVLFKPRDMVSGDLYWMEEHKGRFFIAVVDCTGHGVPGALISLLGHNGLNKAIMEEKMTDPGEILSFLDEQMRRSFKNQSEGNELRDGMDVALCAYDPQKQELSFAGAIEPLYLIRKGAKDIEQYKGDRHAVGGITDPEKEKKSFNTHRIQIQEGDEFYIFSDGYPDQFGGRKGKKLKYKAFRELILEKSGFKDLSKLEQELEKSFEEWRGDHEQVDDVLVIGGRV